MNEFIIVEDSNVAIENTEAPVKRGRGRPPVYTAQQWAHIQELYDKFLNVSEVHRVLSRKSASPENQALLNADIFPEGAKVPCELLIRQKLS